MDLVDEQNDVTASFDLFEHLLEAFLEITAVARAGDERAEVERVELLAVQCVGHVVVDDHLGEALDDGGLADARLTDQHRVVLGAARQDLHHPFEFAGTTDDRIEFVLTSHLGQVAAELVEDLAVLLVVATLAGADCRAGPARLAGAPAGAALAAALAGRPLVAGQQLDDLLADTAEVGAQLHQHLRCDALAFADQPEQDVLGADVVVAELQRFAQRQLEHLLGARGERNVARR